jgi:hypothetical protein
MHVYHVGEASTWELVRRVSLNTHFALDQRLVISDGTVLIHEHDPVSAVDRRIRAMLPDGEERIVWREADGPQQPGTLRARGRTQLLIGPP